MEDNEKNKNSKDLDESKNNDELFEYEMIYVSTEYELLCEFFKSNNNIGIKFTYLLKKFTQ